MKKNIVLFMVILFIFLSACGKNENSFKDSTLESQNHLDIKKISDSEVSIQIKEIQQIIKIGCSKEEAIKAFSEGYELMELYNPSGDSYKEAFLFASNKNGYPFEVKINDMYNNGLIFGKIVKLNEDSFWIENNNDEMSIKYNIFNDLVGFRNFFMKTRKIPITVKIFIDQENKVSNAWIEFVYGEKNAIHSLHYNKYGEIVLSLEDDATH